MPFRALIKTHHMTSRKKIQAITKSAKHHSCSVLIKTGKPPGVMIAEGTEDAVKQWVETVKVCPCQLCLIHERADELLHLVVGFI